MYQKIILVGNLGRDPEMRYTPSGQSVTNFSLAVNRTYTGNDGQRVKETTWFRITAWGKQGENCNEYLKKGSKVLVEGRLTSDPATGGPKLFSRQDGTVGSTFEVSASSVQFLSSKDDNGEEEENGNGRTLSDDEIPF